MTEVREQIEEIILKISISDQKAREFWKLKFTDVFFFFLNIQLTELKKK